MGSGPFCVKRARSFGVAAGENRAMDADADSPCGAVLVFMRFRSWAFVVYFESCWA